MTDTTVPFDAAAQARTRRHEELTAQILNALIWIDQLVRDGDDWNLGYTPADSTDWDGADPTTVGEAIDRCAEALGALTGQGV